MQYCILHFEQIWKEEQHLHLLQDLVTEWAWNICFHIVISTIRITAAEHRSCMPATMLSLVRMLLSDLPKKTTPILIQTYTIKTGIPVDNEDSIWGTSLKEGLHALQIWPTFLAFDLQYENTAFITFLTFLWPCPLTYDLGVKIWVFTFWPLLTLTFDLWPWPLTPNRVNLKVSHRDLYNQGLWPMTLRRPWPMTLTSWAHFQDRLRIGIVYLWPGRPNMSLSVPNKLSPPHFGTLKILILLPKTNEILPHLHYHAPHTHHSVYERSSQACTSAS